MKKWKAQNPVDSKVYQIDFDGHDFQKIVQESHRDNEGENNEGKENPLYICGGLTDLQVNGFRGIDFGDQEFSAPQADKICKELTSEGVTHFLATLTTQSLEDFETALRNLDRLASESTLLGKMMLGIHLEGPFISPEDGPRGAHPLAYCRTPNLDEFRRLQHAAGGRIVILTMSPEFEEAPEFIRQVSDDVIVSIGHTAATPSQIRTAVDCGASMSTHLGNGMHKNIVRHPNYLWEQIADDRLVGGVIADGVHLDASVLKSIVRTKSVGRCFLVSDSTMLAGMPPGTYSNSALGNVEVTEDRRLVPAGQPEYLAGAYRPLRDAMPFLLQNEIAVLPDAIQMMVTNPREILLSRFATATHQHNAWSQSFDSSFVVFGLNEKLEMKIELTVVENTVVFSATNNEN